jgi:hypothetical protein
MADQCTSKSGQLRCELDAGHDGAHHVAYDADGFSWRDSEPEKRYADDGTPEAD